MRRDEMKDLNMNLFIQDEKGYDEIRWKEIRDRIQKTMDRTHKSICYK